MKKYLSQLIWAARIVVAILFILSALFKIYNISGGQLYVALPSFEKQLVDQGITDWCLAPVLARAIIALELFLGFALLQNHFLKKFILPATMGLLVVFCLHLTWQIITIGNEGNCGCMGQVLSFTPLEAIIKNILTLALLSFVYFNTPSKPDSKHRYPSILFLTVTIFCFVYYPWECCCSVTNSISSVLPYPITPSTSDSLEDKHTSNTKLDSIPTKPQKSIKKDPSKVETPSNVVDIPKNSKQKLAPVSSVFAGYTKYNTGDIFPDKGNKIVCLFNVDCDHCMETAKKIGELHRKSPLEVLILFWGNPDQTAAFFKVAGVEFPYQFIEAGKFFRLLDTANSPPRVVVMSQGNIIGDFNSDNFDITKLKELYTTYAP